MPLRHGTTAARDMFFIMSLPHMRVMTAREVQEC